MTIKTNVIIKDLPKSGTLETANVYLMNVPVFYAAVHEPKLKYQSTDKEFSVTPFVDEETKDKLLDEVMLNKTFAQVGVTKTSKPPRRIRYPLSSQVEEGKGHYDEVDGMWGFSLARPEFSKAGNPMSVNVIDKEGNVFTENVGNGSICNIKLFGYRNQDGQLVAMLDTLQVIEHVPYEGKGSGDSVVDDVLGVQYSVKKAEKASAEQAKEEGPVAESKPAAKKAPVKKAEPEPDFDDESLPF